MVNVSKMIVWCYFLVTFTQCPVSNNGFLLVRFCLVRYGHGFINFLTSECFLCPFHKKLEIWVREEVLRFFIKQIIRNLVSSCIVIHYRQLTCRNLEVMNSVSYVSEQRRSPWLSALEIFRSNSCLLVYRGVEYIDTYVRRSFLLLWLW